MNSIKKTEISKNVIYKIIFSCLFYFASLLNLKSQIVNIPVQNFSQKDYGKDYSSQNFCVIQDKAGYVYFGNANGVLQYDGKSWDFIPVKHGAYVSSITLDSSGTLFVGSQNEFGYLKPNNIGKLIYHSLSISLKGIDKEFGTIIKTCVTKESVFFQSQEKIFIYKKDSALKVLNPTTTFHTSFVVNNQFYVRERQLGLQKFSNNTLTKINNGSVFNDMGIFAMLPYNSTGEILIATMEMGLFKYSPSKKNKLETITPIQTLNDGLILKSGLYGGIKLSDGGFAFNTLNEGVILLDKNLNTSHIINKDIGLRVNDVKQLIEDNQHNLWLALNNGVSRVAYQSSLSYYSEENGLQGSVHAITNYGALLFIGTSNGLFYQQTNTNKCTKLKGINSQIWTLIKKEKVMIAAGDEGIYEVDDLNTKKVSTIKCRTLKFDSINQIWVIGNDNGVVLLNKNWQQLQFVNDIKTEVNSIIIESDQKNNHSTAWVGTLQQGIYSIKIASGSNITVNYLGFPNGLTNECIAPYSLNNNIVFGSSSGLYTLKNKINFELAPLFNGLIFNEKISALLQSQQNSWLSTNNQIVLYNSVTSKMTEVPFRNIEKGQIQCFYQDGNICWIGADDGLIRYDLVDNKYINNSFNVQIKKVNCGKDSVIYHGNLGTEGMNNPQLNYSQNSMYFEFTGVFFENSLKNIYSYKLIGQDTAWSNWSNETKATFTNLKEGKYTFLIKSKNVYGIESNTASYSFTIKSPWYRTWLAYALYAILFSFTVYLFIKSRTKKLILEKEQLEKIVRERTKEIVLQKDEISLQKHLVEEKHKEITDSINYAQRIQRSLLASEVLLNKNLKNYFIYYNPKDVVSGDFYWAANLPNNNFCLVTADSTGHGVPGAIMSMLNISCLEKAIEVAKLITPNDILNFTRKKIIETLAKDGSTEGGKDGMDCSLISINFTTLVMDYAMANNPVWIVRDSQIIDIKPDKMPVGKHDRDTEPFTLNTIQLKENDIIYTLTDGYVDQFGGANGKKFMSKNLKELLVRNSIYSLTKQNEILNSTFVNWINTNEQVDDVTIIGIKI